MEFFQMIFTGFLTVIFVIFIVIAAFLNTYQGRGWLGELKVKMVIGKTKPDEQYIINNLKLRIDGNKTSQIDHVVINKNGIFVIETKNYSGRIYGSESHMMWTQVFNRRYRTVKYKLYNPIKQNMTHLYHISSLLPKNFPLYSAVVFVQGNTQNIHAKGVYTLGQLKHLLHTTFGSQLSPQQMREAYEILFDANDSSISRTEHMQNIRTAQNNIAQNTCPRCGRKLVLRHGKNGSFFGCAGYPSCKFTKSA